jgi:hypothetical protein
MAAGHVIGTIAWREEGFKGFNRALNLQLNCLEKCRRRTFTLAILHSTPKDIQNIGQVLSK